ncbi:BC85_0335 family putative methyltransferase [[Mycoplasma] anseris]|uniref:Uncharacterized protein n=1 Tax=[Mycoplasma] anseris TaxID=92400 RepID=A0A2Z4NDP8_9BACT|nr:hypothetical protein [[Mycoplasma] anseris]AWX69711.1 hypothetical protein DP065_03075 [[Mycoplasma] anseris]
MINYAQNVLGKESSLSDKTRLILLITGIIALVIAIVGVVVTLLIRKKMLKKYLILDELNEIKKLKYINPNYGMVLDGIKKEYQNIDGDFFVAFLVNCVYLNKFNRIYVEDDSDYLAISISELTQKPVYINNNVKESHFLTLKPILQSTNLITNSAIKDWDLLVINNNNDFINSIKQNKDFLNDNGMMVLVFNQIKEIKEQKLLISELGFRYETLKIKNKNVILLAKNSIKSMVEESNN